MLDEGDLHHIADNVPGATLLEQCAGNVVHVKPGVIHAVYNKRASLKIAFDVYVRQRMAWYSLAHATLASFFPPSADYMAFAALASALILDRE